jgi:hypothetical protein
VLTECSSFSEAPNENSRTTQGKDPDQAVLLETVS